MAKKIRLNKEKILRNEAYSDRFKKPSLTRDEIKAEKEQKKLRLRWCRVKGHKVTCEFNTCPAVNIGSYNKDVRKTPIMA